MLKIEEEHSSSDQAIFLELTEEFETRLNVIEESAAEDELNPKDKSDDDNEAEDETEEESAGDDEFSFVCGGNTSPIAAEEAFCNGEIRQVFPLFNRDLILSDGDSENLKERLAKRSHVKKVFIETEDIPRATSSSSSSIVNENEEIAGPYCEWSKKAVEANPDACKKSNSTGFSKIWRFRDFIHRSNSDGRDAFVFFNHADNDAKKEEIKSEKIINSGEVKVNKNTAMQKKKKKMSEAQVAHEIYMRSKARDDHNRRRSYLPYRPELVGFFTNVNGGLTRNVHPF